MKQELSSVLAAIAAFALLQPELVASPTDCPGTAVAPQTARQTLAIDRASNDSLWIDGLLIGDRRYHVEMRPHSVRAPGFRVYAATESTVQELPVPPVQTYRGRLEDEEGNVHTIAGSLNSQGELRAYFTLEGQPFALEHVAGGSPGEYEVASVTERPGRRPASMATPSPYGGGPGGPLPGGGGGPIVEVCKIAFDADFEYFQANASSVTNTVIDIETVMAGVAAIYESDVGITFEITTIRVWITAADPYTSAVAATLLNQFQTEWTTNMASVDRNVAHLMTGRTLSAGLLGDSRKPGVCTANGFSLSNSNFIAFLPWRVALVAHHLGRNFNATACTTCAGGCNIMCPCVSGCSGIVDAFNATEIGEIVAYRNSIAACLQNYPGEFALNPFFSERWFDSFLDADRWPYVKGAAINAAAVNAPDFGFTLALSADGAATGQDHEIRSNEFDLAAIASQAADFSISYWTEHRGVESGEKLDVEYFASDLNWHVLEQLTSNGVDQTQFDYHVFAMPADGIHSRFRLRFRCEVNALDDDWFVDLIRVGPELVGVTTLTTPRLTPFDPSVTAQPGKIAIGSAGDWNGDNRDDFLVGYPHFNKVQIYSGLNGSVLQEFTGVGLPRFGAAFALLGDIGNGCEDLVIGAPGTGTIGTVSRLCQPLLFGSFAGDQFGAAIAAVGGDLNADGIKDFIVGAPALPNGAGYVRVVSGADNSTIFTFNGGFSEGFGQSVDSAGDIDGDGKPDILVGVPHALLQSGSVKIFSGADGSLLRTETNVIYGGHMGWSVSTLGDINGDGKPEFIAGAPDRTTSIGYQAGEAIVYDGATPGLILFRLSGDFDFDKFGFSVDGMKDINRDGTRDILVGAPGGDFDDPYDGVGAGTVHIFSGADGSKLFDLRGEGVGEFFGSAVAYGGKLGPKQNLQIIVAAFEHAPSLTAKTYVFTIPNSAPNVQQGHL